MTTATPENEGSGETEEAFLAAYNPRDYPPIAVTADVVLATIRGDRLCILLVKRGNYPQKGSWALPGGFVDPDETLDQAATRELAEETALQVAADPHIDKGATNVSHLEQLGTYGDPGRDPRIRTVTVAYVAIMPDAPDPKAGDDAAGARFWAIDDLAIGDKGPKGGAGVPLAFDHDKIIADGLERIRSKLEYTTLATSFIESPFTMGDLRGVYETVWGIELHAANFRRKVLSTEGFVAATGDTTATDGRPATLFTSGSDELLHPPILRHGP